MAGAGPAAAVVAIALGAIVLIGWATGARQLTSFLPNEPLAKANAAVLLVLAGIALLLWHSESPARHAIARGLGLAIAAIAGLTLLEYATGASLGIDALLPTSDTIAQAAPYPGRIALHASIGLFMAGLAITGLGTSWRRWHPAELAGLACGVVGTFDLLAFAYGAPSVATIGLQTQVALPVALGELVLASGIVGACADHDLVRLLRDPGAAGDAARRILPIILIVLPVGGWLEVGAQRAGLLDNPLGTISVVTGTVVLLSVATWRAIAPGHKAEDALRANEVKYRTLFEESFDGLFVTSRQGEILDMNRKGVAMFGYDTKEEVLLLDLEHDVYVYPPDRARILAMVGTSGSAEYEVDVKKKNGEQITTLCSLTAVRDSHGAISSYRGIIRDITDRKREEAALRAASAYTRALIEASLDPLVTISPDGVITDVNLATVHITGVPRDRLIGTEFVGYFTEPTKARAGYQEVLTKGFVRDYPLTIRDASGQTTEVLYNATLYRDEAGEVLGVFAAARDVTELRRGEAERTRLSMAIEQSPESIIITDREARITYVNRAFERVTGYTRDEVIGQNPRLLKSGLQTPWFYDAMWAALTNGLPWVGDLVNRRKDGTLFTDAAVISPVRDPAGAITSYVAVQRDVTNERELEERSAQFLRERALVSETIRLLRTGEAREATAQEICRGIVRFAGIRAAGLYLFGLDRRAIPIGFVVRGQTDPPLRRLTLERSQRLSERAAEGPWIEPWVNRPTHPYNSLLNSIGVHAVAYAPLRYDQQLIGLLVADAETSIDESATAEVVPALVEFADLAGALIGRDVVERTEAGRDRDHIAGIIARRVFHPVFQPIVDLRSDEIVGYEALTRFHDGANPESVFAQAAAVGLGTELETVTLQAALDAAQALPGSAWLNLNASPELILAGEWLRTVVQGSRRRLVIEVTEHAAIADYPAFRAAMANLGPNVEFAVDDAGIGFSSLRHILELRPAFVKLDRSLIAGIDTDSARQAMVVGLCHFAGATGCRLIVEGIETEGELAVLGSLAVELGQGYLLGRPVPVEGGTVSPADLRSATPAKRRRRQKPLSS